MRIPISLLLAALPVIVLAIEDEPPKLVSATASPPLPGTTLLELEGDLSRRLVEANDRFLDRRLEEVAAESRESLTLEEKRIRLAELLGLDRDERTADPRLEHSAPVSEFYTPVFPGLAVSELVWDAFGHVRGSGQMTEPMTMRNSPEPILADIILLSDAGPSPKVLAGLVKAEQPSAWAATLARGGFRVLAPDLVSRNENRWTLSQREWLHRPAFELGRTLTGYELQMIFAAADAMIASRSEEDSDRPLAIVGHGEGGRLALLAAALDPRFDACLVSGSFGPRTALWKEPAERLVFGLLPDFGDAEIAAMIPPRALIAVGGTDPEWGYRADALKEPNTDFYLKQKGKPGALPQFSAEEFRAEWSRFLRIAGLEAESAKARAFHRPSSEPFAVNEFEALFELLGIAPSSDLEALNGHGAPADYAERIATREARLVADIETHNTLALIESAADRVEYFADLDTSSLEAYGKTIEPYREQFRTEVIGDFEIPLSPPNARTRPCQEGPKTISYEVVLDVFDEYGDDHDDRVIVYGILTLPKDLPLDGSDPPRPVVVCQHGLEGTPQQVVGEEKFAAYKAFATRLAERGFVTFAPQNGYKYFDLFRLQQFKAQSMGKTLFSIIVPQHRQITDWLASLPFVDGDRIGFYGLSYGGKSAMRIPPLVDRYCLSICSADFNEWVWKNAATDPAALRYSYANKGEYEIFEWNLGGTFNYAEMAALICPRPFMVERGHFDGVAPDEMVAHEFAKVRNLFQARLGIGERCEIEWFAGPHSIHGEGTFRFLHRHLDWPEPE